MSWASDEEDDAPQSTWTGWGAPKQPAVATPGPAAEFPDLKEAVQVDAPVAPGKDANLSSAGGLAARAKGPTSLEDARESRRMGEPRRGGGGGGGFDDRRAGAFERQSFGGGGGFERQSFGGGGGFDRRGDDRRGGFEDRRGGFDDRRGGFDDRRGGGFDDRRGGGDRDRFDERPERVPVPFPEEPPFTAYVGNLSFNTTVDELTAYLEDMLAVQPEEGVVKNVRLVEMEGRPKGFGYAEFIDGEALEFIVTKGRSGELAELDGRRLRFDVAEAKRGGMSSRAEEASTWRREGAGGGGLPPVEPLFPRRGGGGDRFGDREDRGGFNRRDIPRERPKLKLNPPSAERRQQSNEPAAPAATASIFGGAKPVDTASRLQQIEERKQQQRKPRDTSADEPRSEGREVAPRREHDERREDRRDERRADDIWYGSAHPDHGKAPVPRSNESESRGDWRRKDADAPPLRWGRDGDDSGRRGGGRNGPPRRDERRSEVSRDREDRRKSRSPTRDAPREEAKATAPATNPNVFAALADADSSGLGEEGWREA